MSTPLTGHQKRAMVDSVGLLGHEARLAILHMVRSELDLPLGELYARRIFLRGDETATFIDVAALEAACPPLLQKLFEFVRARRLALDEVQPNAEE